MGLHRARFRIHYVAWQLDLATHYSSIQSLFVWPVTKYNWLDEISFIQDSRMARMAMDAIFAFSCISTFA